ncbi:MAG: class I SAM-dependent methyltransferase [Anaerolineae bacterium]|nr:class I SAM-dependent methyltransferase [Candidatus Roseilinea sp.]MDW8449327.1 class I SAM-dependent methyltransferase [Anaerolineae bacterium]
MKCCAGSNCRAFESVFDASYAEDDLEEYRAHGPAKSTRALLQAIQDATPVAGATLLDIGGGVGAVHHELLKAGARSAVDVDGSSAFLAAARREAERLGHADRVSYLHGDFVTLAGEIASADIVTLDRVICCYPDMPQLVGAAAARARRVLGLVFPRDAWWARAGVWAVNLFERLRRDPLLFYVHRVTDVDAVAGRNGLRLHFHRSVGILWQVRVYARDATP